MDTTKEILSTKFPSKIYDREKDLSDLLTRVMDAPLQPVNNHLGELIGTSKKTTVKLDHIFTEVEDTNGKLRKLEKNIQKDNEWKEKLEDILQEKFRHHEQLKFKLNELTEKSHLNTIKILEEMPTAIQIENNSNIAENHNEKIIKIISELKEQFDIMNITMKKRQNILIFLACIITALIFVNEIFQILFFTYR